MRVTTTKSKNSESFYITKSYKNNAGKSTSKIIRKLGTLQELSCELNTDRDGVMKWANEQAKIETEKYQLENENQSTIIPFYSNRQLEFNKQRFFMGGYLFLQSVYYELKLDQICKKIKAKYSYEYDLNAILSDLIYTRILEPDSKRSSFKTAEKFLEAPSYELHDVYRALSVLADECDFIQAEAYKNSSFVTKRNDKVLYYDCISFVFIIFGRGKCVKFNYTTSFFPFVFVADDLSVAQKKLKKKYTCDEILDALKEINFANIEDQGFMPLYSREKITDDLHEACAFRTDYQFISKQKMKEIQKKSKLR